MRRAKVSLKEIVAAIVQVVAADRRELLWPVYEGMKPLVLLDYNGDVAKWVALCAR